MSEGAAAAAAVECFSSGEGLSQRAWKIIEAGYASAINVRQQHSFVVGLSGGSLPKLLGTSLPLSPALSSLDWSRCHFVFADERCTSTLDHPDSNYNVCRLELFSKLPALPPANIHAVDPSLASDPPKMAAAYAALLSQVCPAAPGSSLPQIDVLLLGMGPDGHTCSLFPSHPLLEERTLTVAPIMDSPKPPPSRITLTLPVVNAAHSVVFVCTGDSKAAPLKSIFESDEDGHKVPSKLVKPTSGSLIWLVDEPAVSLLTTTLIKRE